MGEDWKPAAAAPSALLLKLRGDRDSGLSLAAKGLAQGGETLLQTGAQDEGFGAASGAPAQWIRIDASDNPWDQVHEMMRMGFAAGSGDLIAAEPDFEQQWVSGPAADKCIAESQDGGGGRAVGPHARWHLDDDYSGLAKARAAVPEDQQQKILIAHVDTGYDPDHGFRPASIAPGERNFVRGEDPGSARDTTPAGGYFRNHGHGTGTIGILAGPEIGGAPSALVLPIRIANSVVHFTTGSMAQGFDYALAAGAHILSMSMGGLASAILADAVNKCYDGGLVMVAAAGNNYSGLPVRSIVYPARMRRVVAACGMMANHESYSGLKRGTMEGCYGPASKMATALSGFTPNIPWPEIGCGDIVDEDGQGTSAATPQIAAAAALWWAKYLAKLEQLPAAWMRGEAVRQALFRSASLGVVDPKLGRGHLRAAEMLKRGPAAASALVREQPASAGWDWIKLLTGRGAGFTQSGLASADRLLSLELAQLAQRDPHVGRAIADPEAGEPPAASRRRFLEAAEGSELASATLKRAIGASLRRKTKAATTILPPAPTDAASPASTPPRSGSEPPEKRRLRIFALDPSLGGALNSYEDQVACIDVRNEPDLKPGPVGEYLEVVDVDPASNRFYPPVDLNDPNLLLQDGAAPSEGNPAFHQQMVYAVAMRTIENFELALGRKALWAPHWTGQTGADNQFVRRLRVYPHALRQENAYYSPDRKALLFGYFPANSRVSDLTPPGTMVFSCLSADIIAHETTHALLDGQSRSFREPSNPDVRAFHEGFSDIVALFQQYTYKDLVRREIARARGDLSAAGLLGGLARQFGEGTGKSGPLRRYPDLGADISYEKSFGIHARGSLLVAAVYEAFLAIVERRTADLVRLATGGSGLLPAGAIHPELVERLADETCRAARHVLRMCIRAIDYCPPVDITFGEYLRALITADIEQVPDDRFGYRVAFLESFRRWQLLPRSLRTVSIETLQWRKWTGAQPAWLLKAIQALDIDVTARLSRDEIYAASETRRKRFREIMLPGLKSQADCDPFGLQHGLKYFRTLASRGYQSGTTFMVDNLRVALRLRDNGELSAQVIAVVRQRRPEPLYERDSDDPEAERFWFSGGTTLVIDLLGKEGPRIRHAIRKPIISPSRLSRERAFRSGDTDHALRATYFGSGVSGEGFAVREPFAIMHQARE